MEYRIIDRTKIWYNWGHLCSISTFHDKGIFASKVNVAVFSFGLVCLFDTRWYLQSHNCIYNSPWQDNNTLHILEQPAFQFFYFLKLNLKFLGYLVTIASTHTPHNQGILAIKAIPLLINSLQPNNAIQSTLYI